MQVLDCSSFIKPQSETFVIVDRERLLYYAYILASRWFELPLPLTWVFVIIIFRSRSICQVTIGRRTLIRWWLFTTPVVFHLVWCPLSWMLTEFNARPNQRQEDTNACIAPPPFLIHIICTVENLWNEPNSNMFDSLRMELKITQPNDQCRHIGMNHNHSPRTSSFTRHG